MSPRSKRAPEPMTDELFWAVVRRALLMVTRVIEKRYGLGESDPEPTDEPTRPRYLNALSD